MGERLGRWGSKFTVSMCGRTSLFAPAPDLETRFDAAIASGATYNPRYNIAPGSNLEIITNDAPESIDQVHWGLLPHWAEAIDDGFINARSETADEKPAFRDAWADRPCLVLSSGFYEWQSPNGGPKQPYRIYRGADTAFAMAGLWQETQIEDTTVRSVTILTTEPNDLVAPIHDRMPVVLQPDDEEAWLTVDPDDRQELCRPYPQDDLEAYPIDTQINNPQNDDPSVIDPADRTQSGLSEFGA